MLPTRMAIQRVECPKCGAPPYRKCVRRVPEGLFKVKKYPRQHNHLERLVEAREKARPNSDPVDRSVVRLLE